MITPALIPVTVAEYLATSYHPDREYIDRTVEERHLGEYDHTNLQSALLAWFRFRQRQWNIRAVAGFETVTGRLDTQAARLERQALLWATGRRWSDGMDTWAAKIEAALETKDRQVADLARRIDLPDETEHLP